MTIIGVSGRIGHGKDTVAEHLVRRWGFVLVRFSAALKEEILDRLPRTLATLHRLQPCLCQTHTLEEGVRRDVYEIKPPGVRELLQEYGTDVRRRDEPGYWVRKWHESLKHRQRVVAPDVRFPNEYEAVRSAGGSLWRVVRPGIEAPALLHESETALDGHPWDAVLWNNGTLAQLHELVDELIRPV